MLLQAHLKLGQTQTLLGQGLKKLLDPLFGQFRHFGIAASSAAGQTFYIRVGGFNGATGAGTVSEAKTAREALTANNEAMATVIATIEAAGVAKKDIQTSNFSVQPKYLYPKTSAGGEQQPPRIVGYTVSNSVSVIVRDLYKLGTIMDAVVSSGVNQMNGLSFTIAKPEPLRDEARKQAVASALALLSPTCLVISPCR